MLYDDRDSEHIRNLVLAATALAWLGWGWTGRGADTHLHTHAADGLSAGAGGALNWLLMLTAMMAPVLIEPIRFIRGQGFARRRGRGTVLFVTGYAAVWSVAGLVLLSIVPLTGLGLVGPAAALGFAALWQCSPAKQHCLNRCHRRTPLAAFGRRADIDVWRFATAHAGWCIGSCGPLMLAQLSLPGGHSIGMVAVTLLIFCERLERPAIPDWRWRGLGTVARAALSRWRMQQQAGLTLPARH